MNRYAIAILLALSGTAYAQTPQLTAQEQVERTIGNLVITNASLQEQLRQAQATIAQMKAAEDERKKSDAAPK